MKIERVDSGPLSGCVRLYNQEIELTVADKFGLIVAGFGFVSGENLIKCPQQLGKLADTFGHRMETFPVPQPGRPPASCSPIKIEEREGSWSFSQDDSESLGMKRELTIISEPGPGLRLVHRLCNASYWPISVSLVCSTWCTVGGIVFAALPGRHMQSDEGSPLGALFLWPTTNLGDPRWEFGKETIVLRYDQALAQEQRIGLTNSQSWLAYWKAKTLFMISAPHKAQRPYDGGGASGELLSGHDAMALTTRSPITTLAPGESLEHAEQWVLYRDMPEPTNETSILHELLPRVAGKSTRRQ